ncbi:MAG: hypothetical protein JWO13_1351 [Acidobacteriales bacterium]|nr:hypothetical protein [Terriglobales bacterium]
MMPGDQDFTQSSRGIAALRAAEALLRTLGGCTVWVRLPVNASAGSADALQLGLAGSVTEDVAIAPVVSRHARNAKGTQKKVELLISAAGLAKAKQISDATSAEQFFDSAVGVIYAGTLMRVESVLVDEFGGVPYLYRVSVSE